MFTPGGVDRWVSFELGRINDGLVVERKSLAALRREARPASRTRSGDEHLFDRQVLERLAGLLTADEAGTLRLPVTLIASGDLGDSVVLSDALGAKAIRALEGFGEAFPYRDGRMVLPHSLALEVVRTAGGAVQIAFG